MILTGSEIINAHTSGQIIIEPFTVEQVNPNSYNFRLGTTLREYESTVLDPKAKNAYREFTIGTDGFVLSPNKLYLAHTIERLGGDVYAPTFSARSSVARLGIFINLSASLGDIGFAGQWTLQLYAVHAVRVYPGMPIGQMMWWKVQGDVDLYSGKYQGAVGPRTSDIHLDYRKAEARTVLPRLRSEVDASDVGSKFATLSNLAHDFRVPDAFAVPASLLRESLDPEILTTIQDVMFDIRATVGAFMGESSRRIEVLIDNYRIPEEARELLKLRINDLRSSHPKASLAVRSSGLDEDGTETSLAGVHQSVLNLVTTDDVLEAIEKAWKAWFAMPAIAARVRAGDFDATPKLALFVQIMIEPQIAGVAFSQDLGAQSEPVIIVEYVTGLADGLVAGTVAGYSYRSTDITHDGPAKGHLDTITAAVRDIRGSFKSEVDVEWAFDDDGFQLLQARPVTAALSNTAFIDHPHLACANLYDEAVLVDFNLGDIASVYASYVAKRGPAHKIARSLGFSTGNGIVMTYNASGLQDEIQIKPLEDFISGSSSPEFVVDFNENMRQIICSRDELSENLLKHVLGFSNGVLGHAIVREFIRGEAGIITTSTSEGILAEVSEDGLMALNRGTTLASQAIVHADGLRVVDPLPDMVIQTLSAYRRALIIMTSQMFDRYGDTTLEWVLHNKALYFTDYSIPPANAPKGLNSGKTISPGVCVGDVIDLRPYDAMLERLSVGPAVSIDKSLDVSSHGPIAEILERIREMESKPVVYASFPFAVLSVLLDDAAGFVFDNGSSLCHLAILLREAGLPAVVTSGTVGRSVVIADGEVVNS